MVLYFHFINEVMFSKRRDKTKLRKFREGGIVEEKHYIFKVNEQKVSTLENNKSLHKSTFSAENELSEDGVGPG